MNRRVSGRSGTRARPPCLRMTWSAATGIAMADDPKLRLLRLERPPSEAMVAHLRDLLARAEAGGLVGLVTVWEQADTGVGFHVCLSPGSWAPKLIGELEIAKHSVITADAGQPTVTRGR